MSGGFIPTDTLDLKAKSNIELQTAPLDARFVSNSNAARYCYTMYNEFYKCLKEKGEEARDTECKEYARKYRSMCPGEWIERWEELRESGQWFGKY